MVNQRPESVGTSLETQPRNVKRISSAIVALTLSTSMIFGASSAEGINSSRANEREVRVNVDADRIHDQDQAATARAYQEAEAAIAWQQAMERNVKAAQIRWLEAMARNNAVQNRIVYDSARWNRLHQCEQPETWHAGGRFGNGLLSSGSGLGMSMDSWQMAVRDAARRGVDLPATAWVASIDQQMQAAQVFWEDEGWGWSCHV